MRYLNYEDYQAKLARHEKYLQLLLYEKTTRKAYLYKPKIASIYGTIAQKQTYFKKLRQKLNINKTNTNDKIAFITLTYDTKLYTATQVVNRCKHDIQKFFKLIRNRIGKINYFWIVELTKRNYVHFHIIAKEYIPAKMIHACWKATTGSIITNVKGISRTQAGKYITKYVSDATKLSEEQAKFLYDNNFKRLYAMSKRFFYNRTRKPDNYVLIGVVTNCFCVAQAEPGEFLELTDIALSYIVQLMEERAYGYVLKREPNPPDIISAEYITI